MRLISYWCGDEQVSNVKPATIGRAGEFYVAATLSRSGLWVTPFSGHLPGYDLVAITPSGTLRLIQIKTSGPGSSSKKGSWWLGKPSNASGAENHFWVFVDLKPNVPTPRYFVLPEKVVAGLHHHDEPGWSQGWEGWDEADLLTWEDRWDLITEDKGAVPEASAG